MGNPKNSFTWYMLVPLLAGGALLAVCLWTLWQGLEAKSWKKTAGVVESVTMDVWEEPQITYRFSVGGIDYRGSKLKLGLLGADPESPVEGAKIIVYFDPEHPERCNLSNSVDRSGLFVAAGLALAMLILPGLSLFFFRKHVPMPPPDALLAPTSGHVPYQPKAQLEIPLGRVGSTRLNIEEWQPGKHILIIQQRTWKLYPLAGAILFITGVFFWMSNQEGVMTREEMQLPLLLWSILIILPGVALSWPSRLGSVSFDWAKDSIRIKSGRSLRVVGLRRVRAIELHYKSTRNTTKAGSFAARNSSWYQFIVWIEAETGETVPFLFASTKARSIGLISDKDREALQQLAQALAVHLNVPYGPLKKSTPLFE